MAVGAATLSLGRYLPGAKALYPVLSLGGRIRFPVKWWYVVALALVPLVGWAAVNCCTNSLLQYLSSLF